jgi:transcriptional regulator with XRE-family HTH domain
MSNIFHMLNLEQIGEEVAAARKLKKLAQAHVAELAGVSLRTINLLENGRATDLGYSKLARILSAVGLELRLGPTESRRPTLDELLKEDAGDD